DDLLVLRERQRLVLAAIESIDLAKRAVFVMAEIDGHTMPEIATALGIPLNTAYSRLRLARGEFADAARRLHARGAGTGRRGRSRGRRAGGPPPPGRGGEGGGARPPTFELRSRPTSRWRSRRRSRRRVSSRRRLGGRRGAWRRSRWSRSRRAVSRGR